MSVGFHQFISGAAVNDAVTEFALGIQRILKRHALDSEIYCPAENIEAALAREKKILPLRRFQTKDRNTTVLFHFSIAGEVSHVFNRFQGQKILFFHNVTPPRYFMDNNDEILWYLLESESELRNIIRLNQTRFYTCSTYNKEQLIKYQASQVDVVPLPLPDYMIHEKEVPVSSRSINTETMQLLYVGRCVPHKKIEKLVFICHVLANILKVNVELNIVGETESTPKYVARLKELSVKLGVASRVHFLGKVTNARLQDLYRKSFFFLHFSEHEGFCLPIIESIHYGLPVLTDGQCAVGETMGGCGIKLTTYQPKKAALMLEYFFSNPEAYTLLLTAVNEKRKTLKGRLSWSHIETWLENLLKNTGDKHE